MRYLSLLIILLIFSCGHKQTPNRVVTKPYIISKAQWGGKSANGTKPEQKITKITIHHGGVFVAKSDDPKAYMRHLQKFSMEDKHWIDIPYHFCIDLQGRIYEARDLKYAGDTNTEYDPNGHALICVIGNYEKQELSEFQLAAVVRLSAWLAYKYHLTPDAIAGHKDYSNQTVCPGKDLYRYLQDGTIKKRVSTLLYGLPVPGKK